MRGAWGVGFRSFGLGAMGAVMGLTQTGLDRGTWCGTVLGVSKTTATRGYTMRNMIIGASAGFVLGWAALIGASVAVSDQGPGTTAEFYGGEYAMDEAGMTQEAFPCEEDEVLGYAPEFGPEHVGCMHVESLI